MPDTGQKFGPRFGAQARILVTGGAGFIGCNLLRLLLAESQATVLNVDKLVIPGCRANVADLAAHPRYRFAQTDLVDRPALTALLRDFRPTAVMHLAAESHVDRSIDNADPFIESNIIGTYSLLEATRDYLRSMATGADFRFLHVSTDEVHGSLADGAPAFTEQHTYAPNSPYAASKAASDHLARAWQHTHGLPVLISNCSNNYGPFQFPEKLIPLTITKALREEALPVYGQGSNIRDWLHVLDHAHALLTIIARGIPGERYNVGGNAQRRNIDVVGAICTLLDGLQPRANGAPHADLISFVTDRPGHDFRYAIDAGKLRRELLWQPATDFATGLRETVAWYLHNQRWCATVTAGSYQGQRLGLQTP